MGIDEVHSLVQLRAQAQQAALRDARAASHNKAILAKRKAGIITASHTTDEETDINLDTTEPVLTAENRTF